MLALSFNILAGSDTYTSMRRAQKWKFSGDWNSELSSLAYQSGVSYVSWVTCLMKWRLHALISLFLWLCWQFSLMFNNKFSNQIFLIRYIFVTNTSFPDPSWIRHCFHPWHVMFSISRYFPPFKWYSVSFLFSETSKCSLTLEKLGSFDSNFKTTHFITFSILK